jgi:hypothetical protein
VSARPVLAALLGPSSFAAEDEGAVVRALTALPEGSVLCVRAAPGLEAFASHEAARLGVHVATVSAAPGGGDCDGIETMFRLGVERVYAYRRGGQETVTAVGFAEGMVADVHTLGLGEGRDWANSARTPARVAVANAAGERRLVALVSGSRGWRDIAQVYRDLSALPEGSVVVHGDAPGLDRIAAAVARVLGFAVVGVPALWDFFGVPGQRGNPAGFRRNEAMARFAVDRLYAYPLDGPGTRGMIDHAEECCIEVRESDGPLRVPGRDWATVVHCRSEAYEQAAQARYAGRGRDPRTGEFGEFGNRYSHRDSAVPGVVRVATPEEAVVRYWFDLRAALRSGAVRREKLAELHGALLGCWCGERQICHAAHVLAPAAAWAAKAGGAND